MTTFLTLLLLTLFAVLSGVALGYAIATYDSSHIEHPNNGYQPKCDCQRKPNPPPRKP